MSRKLFAPHIAALIITSTACLEPPAAPEQVGNDSGIAPKSLDIKPVFSPVASEKRAPLRVRIDLYLQVSSQAVLGVELREGPGQKSSCLGEKLEIDWVPRERAVRLSPRRVLKPDRWHCIRLRARNAAKPWEHAFQTVKASPLTHILWPPPGSRIPENLDRFKVFSTDSFAELKRWHAALDDGSRVPLSTSVHDCTLEGERGACLDLYPKRLLKPGDTHLFLVRHDDVPIEASFLTKKRDHKEPARLEIGCMPGAQTLAQSSLCVRKTASDASFLLQLDEPALVFWRTGLQRAYARAPFGEARFTIDHVETGMRARLALIDLAGNTSSLDVQLPDEPPSPSLTIEALRSNPRGPEPGQELISLHNHGQKALELSDFRVGATFASAQQLPIYAIGPNERVVLVPPGFDPHHPADERPPVGMSILRLEQEITERGVANQGEPVQLWGPNWQWVAGVPPQKTSSGLCVRRKRASGHADLPRHFAHATCFGPLP